MSHLNLHNTLNKKQKKEGKLGRKEVEERKRGIKEEKQREDERKNKKWLMKRPLRRGEESQNVGKPTE